MAKRDERRSKRHQRDREQTAHMAASMMMGAIMSKAFHDVFGGDKPTEQNVIDVPTDGTAVELPVQEGFEVFISEEGKPMVRRKVERKEEKDGSAITYEDIAKDLYRNVRNIYFWGSQNDSVMTYEDDNNHWQDLSNCMSEAQVKRLIAINKLQNIALYLNDGWKPDFYDTEEDKFYIAFNGGDVIDKIDDEEFLNFSVHNNIDDPCYSSMVYFKTEELAYKAIAIMGEESLKDLFSTDW